MYEFYDYLKTNNSLFEKEYDVILNNFNKNVINNLKVKQIVSYKVSFYIKNFNQEKYFLINSSKVNLYTEEFNIFDKPNLKNDISFEEFKVNRYKYQQDYFKFILKKIEQKYIKNLNKKFYQNKEGIPYRFKCFLKAISSIFPGPLKKQLFLSSFFREHFSFERSVFREYNFEQFSSKDVVIYVDKYKRRRYIEKVNTSYYLIKRDYINFDNIIYKNKLALRLLYNTLNNYIESFNRSILLKNLFLYHIKTFSLKKTLKERLNYIYYLNHNFFCKHKIRIPNKFRTNNVYLLHYASMNDSLLKEAPYSKKIHPLNHLKRDFDVYSFSIEEIDKISLFMYLIIREHNLNNNYIHDRTSILDLLEMNKSIGMYIIDLSLQRYNNQFFTLHKVNSLVVVPSLKKNNLKKYQIKLSIDKKIHIENILNIKNFNSKTKCLKSLIKENFYNDYVKDTYLFKEFKSVKFRNFFFKLFYTRAISIHDEGHYLNRLNDIKEYFFYLFLNSNPWINIVFIKNLLSELDLVRYKKTIDIYFYIIYFHFLAKNSQYKYNPPSYVKEYFLYILNLSDKEFNELNLNISIENSKSSFILNLLEEIY